MSANDILGYVFTTLSFLSVIYALFGNKTGIFACVLVLLALSSFLFLIQHLKYRQNKTYTLQILSRENRSLALRLLLTYEQLKCSTDVFSEKFFTPKLYVDSAKYSYKIVPSDDISKNNDLECIYKFHIRKAFDSRLFDILIAQPRGKSLETIKYKFSESGKERTANVKKINIAQNKTDFSGFWKAQISMEGYEHIQILIVSYTLKEVYRTHNTSGSFLLCPFVMQRKCSNLI